MTDPYPGGQPYLADSSGVPAPYYYGYPPPYYAAPPCPPIAHGGGYPCDPSEGDLAVAGIGPVRRAGLGHDWSPA